MAEDTRPNDDSRESFVSADLGSRIRGASTPDAGRVIDAWAAATDVLVVALDQGPNAGKTICLQRFGPETWEYVSRLDSDGFRFNFPEDERGEDHYGGELVPELEFVIFILDLDATRAEKDDALVNEYGSTDMEDVIDAILSERVDSILENGNEPETLAYAIEDVRDQFKDFVVRARRTARDQDLLDRVVEEARFESRLPEDSDEVQDLEAVAPLMEVARILSEALDISEVSALHLVATRDASALAAFSLYEAINDERV